MHTYKVWVNLVNRCDIDKSKSVPQSSLSVQLTIADILVHEDFKHIKSNTFVDDMVVRDAALIRVKEPISHIATLRSVCLPNKSDWGKSYEREVGQISGWGQLSQTQRGEASCALQVGRVKVVSSGKDEGCKGSYIVVWK